MHISNKLAKRKRNKEKKALQKTYLLPSLDIAGLGHIGLTVEEENVHVGSELNRSVDSPNVTDIVDRNI